MTTTIQTLLRGVTSALVILAVSGSTLTSSGQVSIKSPLSDDTSVIPGSTYSGSILAFNETSKIQTVRVYQTDYSFQSDGTNVYGSPGQETRSNADWIIISSSEINIPPHQSADISYTVVVPESSETFQIEGSYWSLIMVEAVNPNEGKADSTGVISLGVRQVLRFGIQVATHIKNSGAAQLVIRNSDLVQTASGDTELRLDIANNGNLMMRPDVWVELYAADGAAVGRFDGSKNRLYPDTSVRQRISLGLIDPGSYRAVVVMDGGGTAIFGSEFALEIVEPSDSGNDG